MHARTRRGFVELPLLAGDLWSEEDIISQLGMGINLLEVRESRRGGERGAWIRKKSSELWEYFGL